MSRDQQASWQKIDCEEHMIAYTKATRSEGLWPDRFPAWLRCSDNGRELSYVDPSIGLECIRCLKKFVPTQGDPDGLTMTYDGNPEKAHLPMCPPCAKKTSKALNKARKTG
jgi:hypothetical protein